MRCIALNIHPIKLRLDGSGTVTYTDYVTGTSSTGSYSTTTHLFQTSAPDSGFPMPIYGIAHHKKVARRHLNKILTKHSSTMR